MTTVIANSVKNHLVFIFTVICIITSVTVIGRTAVGTTIFALHEYPCDNNDTLHHQHNLNEESIHIDSQRYYRFSQLLYCFLSIVHWFEYGYLFYGIFCFLENTVTDERLKGKSLCDPEVGYAIIPMVKPYPSVIKRIKEKNYAVQKKFLRTKIQPILTTIFIVFFLGCSITQPIASIVYASQKVVKNENCRFAYIAIGFAYDVFTVIARTITVLVRIIFSIAAGICGTIWLKQESQSDPKPSTQQTKIVPETQKEKDTKSQSLPIQTTYKDTQSTPCTCACSKDREEAVSRFYKIMIDYKNRMERVRPLYKVFQSWFVFQWVHYLLEISHDLVYLLRPWLTDQPIHITNYTEFYILNISACLYDLLAILTPYLAALKMNAYLRRYIRRQQQKQEKEAKDTKSEAQYAYAQSEFKIQTNPKSTFIPRAPGLGLKLSLDGPGFVFSTVLLIIGSVATFTKF